MGKKRKRLSLLLILSLVLQTMVLSVTAANDEPETVPLRLYLSEEELAIQNGQNALNKPEDVEAVKDLDAFTLTMDFKTNSSGLQSLFFVGSDQVGTQNQYFNLYVWNRKAGIEVRDGVVNPSIFAEIPAVAGENYHTVSLVYQRNEYYKIYLDGELVLQHTNANDTGRFLDSLGMTPNTMSFGMGTRTGGANNYPFTGSMRNIRLYNKALSEKNILKQHGIADALETGPVLREEGLKLDGVNTISKDFSDKISDVTQLTQGTIHARFRVSDPAKTEDAGLMTLFSVSDKKVGETYANFFVRPASNKIGLEIKNNNNSTPVLSKSVTPGNVSLDNTDWHTASFSMNKKAHKLSVYLDGELCMTGDLSIFFQDMANIDTVRIGDMARSGKGEHTWKFLGDIDLLEVYANPFTEENVKMLHEPTIPVEKELELPDTAVKTDPVNLFYANYNGSSSYRIPSLLTTSKGTVIAAIDERNTGAADCGNINTVVRRSEDNGKTWGDPITVVDLPDGAVRYSFTIDASMVEDTQNGEIHLLVDMFPESNAIMDSGTLVDGSGYKEMDGEKYLILRDYTDSVYENVYTNEYTVREDGQVYNADGETTEYTADIASGELKKSGQAAGNIYIYTGENAGDIKAVRTCHLWLFTSKDDGKTWSDPVDLNGQVKEDWMRFMGTGPGIGTQIKNGPHAGRLVYPVYHTNSNVGGSQCAAVIYSDDGGQTWRRGVSPIVNQGIDPEHMNHQGAMLTESQVVEVGNTGRLKIFMRNLSGKVQTATSDDGGATWKNLKQDPELFDSYCQMSVIRYPGQIDGKDAYLFLNPASGGRNDGTVRLGFYHQAEDKFEWKYKQMIHQGRFQYSCLTVLKNGQIGAFYEGDVPNMRYTNFSLDWITAPRTEELGSPYIENVEMQREGDKLTFTVDFDQYTFRTGTPVLNLKVDKNEAEAVYVSGQATKQFLFEYTLDNPAASEVQVIGVSGNDGSTIGNRINVVPAIKEGDSYIFH